MQEKVVRVAKQNKHVVEKLTALLAGQIMQEAFQENSEAEQSAEGEESELVGMEDVGATGGTQSSVMEVNEEEEEVVVVEEGKQRETWKQALSLPPKTLRKRVQAGTAIQTPVGSQVQVGSMQGSQVGSGQVGSTRRQCDWCRKYRIECVIVVGPDARIAERNTTSVHLCW